MSTLNYCVGEDLIKDMICASNGGLPYDVVDTHGHRQHGYRPLGIEYLEKLIRCAREIDIIKSVLLHEVDGDGYEYYADNLTHADYESVSVAYREECLGPEYLNPMYR